MNDVRKILGAPPGAFFAGEVKLTFPGGRRFWPFTGTGKDFQAKYPEFFDNKLDSTGSIDRAWISNDIAIWLTFDESGKVYRKAITEVMVPNENDELAKSARKMMDEMQKKKQ